MATYADVIRDVKNRQGITVKTCWIAHVKELNGIPTKKAPNRKDARICPCPHSKKNIIEQSMRRLGMIK